MWKKEDFQRWRARPETKQFFAYLNERRNALMEAWAEGQEMPAQAQSLAITYTDIIDLDYDRDIEPFYATEEEEDDAE